MVFLQCRSSAKRKSRNNHDIAITFLIAVIICGPQRTVAEPGSGSGSSSSTEYGTDYNGGDITRPENNFETRFEDRTSGTTTRTDEQVLVVQFDGAVKLDAAWKLGWLAELPLVAQTTEAPAQSNSSREFGMGDAVFQGVLSRPINERWAFGFGARLVAPTAEDDLGSGRWQIMPGFGVRYSFLEFGDDTYFVPKIRYAMSFGGDPSRRYRNEPQIAPTLNIELPDRWFVTFYPSYDIRINYGNSVSGQTGRLFLPFDAAIGRKLTDKVVVSLEVGVPIIKDYPVYNFKAELLMAYEF